MKARQQADPPREDSQRLLPLPVFFFCFFLFSFLFFFFFFAGSLGGLDLFLIWVVELPGWLLLQGYDQMVLVFHGI